MTRIVEAFLANALSIDDAATQLVELGFGESFGVGAETEAGLETAEAKRLIELMNRVFSIHDGIYKP